MKKKKKAVSLYKFKSKALHSVHPCILGQLAWLVVATNRQTATTPPLHICISPMERSASYTEKSRSAATVAGAGAGDLRCHSAYYVTSTYSAPPPPPLPPLWYDDAGSGKASKIKKKKAAATWPSSSASKGRVWGGLGLGDTAEMQRRRRVAGYRVYGVEGKVKVSLKSSMRWIKGKCTRVVDGWW